MPSKRTILAGMAQVRCIYSTNSREEEEEKQKKKNMEIYGCANRFSCDTAVQSCHMRNNGF
jgi:hypothetical protein